MVKRTRVKNPDAVTLRDCFGTTALSTVNGLCTVFMSSLFMQYMTDYAGLGAMGATLATSLLLFARIFDAVDDPIQGFVMDRGKRTKIGKYKPFFLLSILLTGIGCILLYSLPSAFATKPVLIVVWVIFFYLMFDVGTSFYKDNLLFRTMTNDPNERSKLVIGPPGVDHDAGCCYLRLYGRAGYGERNGWELSRLVCHPDHRYCWRGDGDCPDRLVLGQGKAQRAGK